MSDMITRQQKFETLRAVFQRAVNDEAFRQLCLRDAEAAIKQATGRETPAEFKGKIQFKEPGSEGPGMVLPAATDLRAHETLSDEELAAVAGGSGVCWNTSPLCWDTNPL